MSPNVSIALGLIRRAQAELRGLKLTAQEQASLETQVEELVEIIAKALGVTR